LTSLNLASNGLGELILPAGWEKKSVENDCRAPWFYEHANGTKQDNNPGKPERAITLANAIPGMGALTSLNLASNSLGELVLPDGWTKRDAQSQEEMDAHGDVWYEHTDGTEQKEDPGSKPEGIIALANVIPDMGALTSLNLAVNGLDVDGAKIIAAVLPGCT
jgi:hypothetical protein